MKKKNILYCIIFIFIILIFLFVYFDYKKFVEEYYEQPDLIKMEYDLTNNNKESDFEFNKGYEEFNNGSVYAFINKNKKLELHFNDEEDTKHIINEVDNVKSFFINPYILLTEEGDVYSFNYDIYDYGGKDEIGNSKHFHKIYQHENGAFIGENYNLKFSELYEFNRKVINKYKESDDTWTYGEDKEYYLLGNNNVYYQIMDWDDYFYDIKDWNYNSLIDIYNDKKEVITSLLNKDYYAYFLENGKIYFYDEYEEISKNFELPSNIYINKFVIEYIDEGVKLYLITSENYVYSGTIKNNYNNEKIKFKLINSSKLKNISYSIEKKYKDKISFGAYRIYDLTFNFLDNLVITFEDLSYEDTINIVREER